MRMRKACIDDLSQINKIEKAAHTLSYYNERSLKHIINTSITDSVIVFEINNRIIGFLIEQSCLNEISILNVAVDITYQDKGVGKKLIKQYLSKIPDNSIVFLEVNRNNFKARKIYTDLKFHKVFLRKKYYNNAEDAVIMKYKK